MKEEISKDNELALKIIDLLKGESYYVAIESLKLAKLVLEVRSIVQ